MAEFEMPEKPDNRKERVVGLIIAAIAVVLAIVSSQAHETHNDEILAHVDGADQYAFYQAKKERHAALELSTDNLMLEREKLSAATQPQVDQLLTSYAAEMAHLDSDGKGIQAKGDELMAESKRLAQKAKVLDLGEIALQIAVVLCSISIITEQNLFVHMGGAVAGIGILVAIWGMVMLA
jgi:hypothetical protein